MADKIFNSISRANANANDPEVIDFKDVTFLNVTDANGNPKKSKPDVILKDVKSEVNRVIAITQNDLSRMDAMGNVAAEMNTANCYIVHKNGSYFLPLVYGNAIKGSKKNAAAYTRKGTTDVEAEFVNHLGNAITSPYIEENIGCKAASCEVVWMDDANFISDLQIVDGTVCRGLRFSAVVPDINANAIVAVKDSDGNIIWSWHIWGTFDDLTPYTITNHTGVEYKFMPQYLGWKWDNSSKQQGRCCHYQWGRKDPMPVASAYNSSSTATLYGSKSFTVAAAVNNLYEAISKPNVFFTQCDEVTYNWHHGTSKYNLWNANLNSAGAYDDMATAIKTVYDPCPAGFMLPAGRAWTGFTTTGNNTSTRSEFNVVGEWSAGWMFKRNSADTVGVRYPAAGYRYRTSGGLANVAGELYVWSFAPGSQTYVSYLYAYSGYVTPLYWYYRASGFSVAACSEF